MTPTRRLFRTTVAFLVVFSMLATAGIADPVVAQSGSLPANNTTTNSTSSLGSNPVPGSQSHWTNGSNNTSTGRFDVGLNPTEWVVDIADWSKQQVAEALRWTIQSSMSLWIGTPYAHIGSNGVPSNEPFTMIHTEVYGDYVFPFTVLFLGLFIVMSAVAMSASTMFSRGRITRWLGRMGMAIIVVGLAYDLTNLMQHLSHAIAWAFAPSPTELTNSMKGVFKLGAGPVVGVIGLYVAAWTEALLLALVYGFRQLVLLLAPVMMPIILLTAYAAPHRRLRMLGSLLFWQWFGLVWVSLPVAILLRIAYELEWSFGVGGLIGFFLTLAIFTIALVLPFVFSYGFFRFPPAITTGAAAVSGAAASKAGTLRDRYGTNDDDSDSISPSKSRASRPKDRVVAADGGITEGQASLLADRMNARKSRPDCVQTAERIRAVDDTDKMPRIFTNTRKRAFETKSRQFARNSKLDNQVSISSESYQAKPRYRLRRTGDDD